MKALVKLSGPNRKVWFLSEDGDKITHIKDNQEIYEFSGSGGDAPTAEPVYTYKGSKDTYEELPTEDNAVGDVWNVVAAHEGYAAGMNYAWDGTDWDATGGLYADTWRPIKVNSSDAITDSSTALNLKAGSHISLSTSGGTITIAASGIESTEETITDSDVTIPLLYSNRIFYCTNSNLASLSIYGALDGFKYCAIIFNSPSTPTQFGVEGIGDYYCVGDDCTGGAFTPVANMRYNLAVQREYDRIAIYVMRAL